MKRMILANKIDNVVTTVNALEIDDQCDYYFEDSVCKITVTDTVPVYHKVAIKAIEKGEDIIKYGEVIGCASHFIKQGGWVHIHNVDSNRGRGDRKNDE